MVKCPPAGRVPGCGAGTGCRTTSCGWSLTRGYASEVGPSGPAPFLEEPSQEALERRPVALAEGREEGLVVCSTGHIQLVEDGPAARGEGDPGGSPVVRVGLPGDQVAVLQGVAAAQVSPAPARPRPEWSAHHRKVRASYPSGPGGWHSSAMPR